MNGSRLSDDAALVRGLEWMQQQAAGAARDPDQAERALAMIAMRYPEEADELRELWLTEDSTALGALLGRVREQFRQDAGDDV